MLLDKIWKKYSTCYLTLSPPKTNIFVHGKNCTFSKKGLGHKGRCYSVCIDDTCKWISHTLSRIIGLQTLPQKLGCLFQTLVTWPKYLLQTLKFWSTFMCVHANSCKVYLCSHKIHAFLCKFMHIHSKFICVHVKFYMNLQSTSIKVPAHQL